MIRALLFFLLLGLLALGANWVANRPGEVVLTWLGSEIRVSVLAALVGLACLVVAVVLLWTVVALLVRAPGLLRARRRARRRQQGLLALTSGIVAVGAGDARAAARHALTAERHLADEPLALLLRAQAAQLADDRTGAEAVYRRMLDMPETRIVGLRGLHAEARRRGDADTAYCHALEARKVAPLPWAGQAVLDHHTSRGDWSGALLAVEQNAADGLVDRRAADRQRAVLRTALALDREELDPKAALALARDAARLAPDLIPAAALTGRLMIRAGETRKATRLLEAAWKLAPHPDLGDAYLTARAGETPQDRLARARKLADLAPEHPEARMMLGRAALEARDFELARTAMMPLFEPDAPHGRPTARACLTMAELEEEAGAPARAREWLARAARAARDPAWLADGIVSDKWLPASPATGRLDAFVWGKPREEAAALPGWALTGIEAAASAAGELPLLVLDEPHRQVGVSAGASLPAFGAGPGSWSREPPSFRSRIRNLPRNPADGLAQPAGQPRGPSSFRSPPPRTIPARTCGRSSGPAARNIFRSSACGLDPTGPIDGGGCFLYTLLWKFPYGTPEPQRNIRENRMRMKLIALAAGVLLTAATGGLPARAQGDVTVGFAAAEHRLAVVRQLHQAVRRASRLEGLEDCGAQRQRRRADPVKPSLRSRRQARELPRGGPDRRQRHRAGPEGGARRSHPRHRDRQPGRPGRRGLRHRDPRPGRQGHGPRQRRNWSVKAVGDGASVVIIDGLAGQPAVTLRHEAIDPYFKEHKIQVLGVQPADWDSNKAATVTEDLLTRFPDVKAIFSLDGSMTPGVLRTVADVGYKGPVIGLGGTATELAALKAGTLWGTTCMSTAKNADAAIDAIEAVAAGKTVEKMQAVLSPPVTKDNLGSCPGDW